MLAVALASLTALTVAPAHETAAQRHHRKGVHCMDVIERNDCATEQFELVLEEDTRDRELVTDAMLRLIRLYRKADDADGLAQVLRRWWDVGTQRQSRGHVAYGMRFVPAELDVLFAVDIERLRDAPVLLAAGPRTPEYAFTCDDQVRADILMTQRWRRAERTAAAQGITPAQAYYAEMDERRARRERYAEQREDRREEPEARDQREPIFSALPCPLAKALGDDGMTGWRRISGAASHQDFGRSMMIVDLPDADAKLAAAQRRGTLEPAGEQRWTLASERYADQTVHILRVDLDQILVARADMVEPVVEAARKRRRRMNRELEKLARQVPRDSAFYFVMTRAAVAGMGFGGMRRGAATMLQALLPKPKGLQVAVAAADVAGVFTRVPTDNPVKGRMLVSLARTMVEGQTSDDPEAAAWLENLDIAEAGDRKALLAAYLIDAAALEKLIY
ncbi:MAG: hypothetical protein AAGA54_02170 [Myxococcota bacterium]